MALTTRNPSPSSPMFKSEMSTSYGLVLISNNASGTLSDTRTSSPLPAGRVEVSAGCWVRRQQTEHADGFAHQLWKLLLMRNSRLCGETIILGTWPKASGDL